MRKLTVFVFIIFCTSGSLLAQVEVYDEITNNTGCLVPNGEIKLQLFGRNGALDPAGFTFQWFYGVADYNPLDPSDFYNGSALQGVGTHHVSGMEEGSYTVIIQRNSTSSQMMMTFVVLMAPILPEISLINEPQSSVFHPNGCLTLEQIETEGEYSIQFYSVGDNYAFDLIENFGYASLPLQVGCELEAGKYAISFTERTLGCEVIDFITVENNVIKWIGVNNDWNDASNWDKNRVPTEEDDVYIPGGGLVPMIHNTSGVCKNLWNEYNGLDIYDGSLHITKNLRNDGVITFNDGSRLRIDSTRSGDGNEQYFFNYSGGGSLHAMGSPLLWSLLYNTQGDYFYEYDYQHAAYEKISDINYFYPAKGFFIGTQKATGNAVLVGLTITDSIFYHVSDYSALGGDGFNLLANPYTAPLDVAAFLSNPNNQEVLTGVIYLWNDGGQNYGETRAGNYLTVNQVGAVGSTAINGVAGTKSASDFQGKLSIAQGFFVEAKADGHAYFNPNMLADEKNDANSFFRQSTENKQLKIKLISEKFNDEVLVTFRPDATDQIDYGMDAVKRFGNQSHDLYIKLQDQKLAIAALSDHENVVVSLEMNIHEAGFYTIQVADLQNFGAQEIFLKDLQTNQVFDLSEETEIRFYADSGNDLGRFEIVYNQLPNSVLSAQLQSGHLKVWAKEGTVTVSGIANGKQEIVVYDLAGKVVFSESVTIQDNTCLLRHPALIQGDIYLLQSGNQVAKFRVQ